MGKEHRSQPHDQNQRREAFLAAQLVRQSRMSGSWALILAGSGVLAMLLYAGIKVPGPFETQLAQAESWPTGQDVGVETSQFKDGKARFYTRTTAAGREVRFFVLWGSDGVVRAGFDACDVCYRERRGYHQEGDTMVCNNCGRAFQTSNVNAIAGGCNPVPLQRTLTGDQVMITAESIEVGIAYF